MRVLLLVPILVLLLSGCFGPSPSPPGPEPDAPNFVQIVRFEPGVPATLHLGDRLHVVIRYRMNAVDGVRIFARPFTNGHPTPGYGAHSSPTYGRGEGEVVGWFKFDDPAEVHQVRVQMVNAANQNQVIAEAWRTINSEWVGGPAPKDGLEIVDFKPPVPATLHTGDRLHVKVHYQMQSVNQVRIFVRPFTNGQPTPGYGAHASQTYGRGEGDITGWFTFQNPAKVHQVRVQMVDAANPNHVLVEIWHKVNSQWVKP